MKILEDAKRYEKEYEQGIKDSQQASHIIHAEKATLKARQDFIPSLVLVVSMIVSIAIFCKFSMWFSNGKLNIITIAAFVVINSVVAALVHNRYEDKIRLKNWQLKSQRELRDALWDCHNGWENIELFGSDKL